MPALSSHEFTQAIARKWLSRRTEQALKPKGVKHATAQLEFFIGAFSAAEAIGQPYNSAVLMLLAVGGDAAQLLPKEAA